MVGNFLLATFDYYLCLDVCRGTCGVGEWNVCMERMTVSAERIQVRFRLNLIGKLRLRSNKVKVRFGKEGEGTA